MKHVPIVLLTSFLAGCSSVATEKLVVMSDSGSETLHVEIADTPEEHQEGLMNRDRMPKNTGMLFVFDAPKERTFWMKDTKIPLDIFFFDGEGAYISSTSMMPCDKDPCPLYPSMGEAQYALEVLHGDSALAVGDESLRIQKNVP